MKYKICPLCNAHLDHGERCDCRNNVEPPVTKPQEHRRKDPSEETDSPPPFMISDNNKTA